LSILHYKYYLSSKIRETEKWFPTERILKNVISVVKRYFYPSNVLFVLGDFVVAIDFQKTILAQIFLHEHLLGKGNPKFIKRNLKAHRQFPR